MSWAAVARALFLLGAVLGIGPQAAAEPVPLPAVTLVVPSVHSPEAARQNAASPPAELTWRRQLLAFERIGTTSNASPMVSNPGADPGPESPGVLAVASAGKAGRIVLLSAGQLFNDTGPYRVSGERRVRKTAGFEIAYDYYFKPDDPSHEAKNLKSVSKRSMPLILATSFLVMLIVCIAVCVSAICWERTRRLVANRAPTTHVTAMELSQRNGAAGDSNIASYGNDKYMI